MDARIIDPNDLPTDHDGMGYIDDVIEDIRKTQRDLGLAVTRRAIVQNGPVRVQRRAAQERPRSMTPIRLMSPNDLRRLGCWLITVILVRPKKKSRANHFGIQDSRYIIAGDTTQIIHRPTGLALAHCPLAGPASQSRGERSPMAEDNKIVTKKTTTRKAPAAATDPGKPATKSPLATTTTPVAKKPAPVRATAPRPASPGRTAASTPVPKASTPAAAPKATRPSPTPAAPTRAAPAPTRATSNATPVPTVVPAAKAPATKPTAKSDPTGVTAEEREAMIKEAAYFLAEKHGFDPSFDSLNWEEATQQIVAHLAKGGRG